AARGPAPGGNGGVVGGYRGGFVVDSRQAIGLARDVRVLPEVSTGVSICVEAPGKDRAFISMRGALDRFDASMVPADALACSFLLLCGYFTLSSLRCRPAAGVKVGGRRFLRRAANSRRRTYARDTTSIAC